MRSEFREQIRERKEDESKEKFDSICKSLGVKDEERRIIEFLSYNERSSVTEISHYIPEISRRWVIELLMRMVSRKAVLLDGKLGKHALYKLNLDNEAIDSLTSGFRRWGRKTRRTESEWKSLVMTEIENPKDGGFEILRPDLVKALSKTKISDARLSQIIGKLIEENRVEKLQGRGFACYKAAASAA